jgi:hypothetical protein
MDIKATEYSNLELFNGVVINQWITRTPEDKKEAIQEGLIDGPFPSTLTSKANK